MWQSRPMIDWINFTPYSALAGGILIGIGVAILILFNGRVAGISGIIGDVVSGLHKNAVLKDTKANNAKDDSRWRTTFIIGLILAPLLWQLFTTLPAIVIEADYVTLAIAGFVVGMSTRYGAGCTSGHGVCGISRLSLRAIVATLAFMFSGALTVYVLRHLLTS